MNKDNNNSINNKIKVTAAVSKQIEGDLSQGYAWSVIKTFYVSEKLRISAAKGRKNTFYEH